MCYYSRVDAGKPSGSRRDRRAADIRLYIVDIAAAKPIILVPSSYWLSSTLSTTCSGSHHGQRSNQGRSLDCWPLYRRIWAVQPDR